MLERNAKVKEAPERWQDERNEKFDFVITFEDRVFDVVVEGGLKPLIAFPFTPSQTCPIEFQKPLSLSLSLISTQRIAMKKRILVLLKPTL